MKSAASVQIKKKIQQAKSIQENLVQQDLTLRDKLHEVDHQIKSLQAANKM